MTKSTARKLLSILVASAMLLALLPAALIPASAETKAPAKDDTEHLLYYDNFTEYPFNGDWGRADGNGDGASWYHTMTASGAFYHNAAGSVVSEYCEADAAIPGDDLVSPYFDIPASGKTTMSFWATGTYGEASVGYRVEGGSTVTVKNLPVSIYSWVACEIDFSEFDGGALMGKRVCIVIINKDSHKDGFLAVDDFKVSLGNGRVILSEDFSADPFKRDGWTFEDIDGDGYNWGYEPGSEE